MSKRSFSNKRVALIMLVIGIVVIGGMSLLGLHIAKQNARQSIDHALQYLKKQCFSYREVIMADQVKSLMRLTEQTAELATDGKMSPQAQSNEYLAGYAMHQRMSSVLVLNDEMEPEYAYGTDADWSDIYKSKAIQDVLRYPEKIYAERMQRSGCIYDIAAVARQDEPGVIFCVRERNLVDLIAYQTSVENLLGGYNSLLNGSLYTFITDGETVVAGSDDGQQGERVQNIPLIQALEESGGNGMTEVRSDGVFFGAFGSYREYKFYVFLPASYVFSESRDLVITTFGVYVLAVLVITLLMAGINQERKRRELNYQRRLEEEVARATQADQAKTDFLRSMSHDIRTPINIIMGMMEIIGRNPENTKLVQDCRGKAQLASRYLLALVDDVLTLNRMDGEAGTAAATPYCLSTEILEVMTLARVQAEFQGVILAEPVMELQHDEFLGNPLYLRQICQNIIGNAIKYSTTGGEVRCSFRESREEDGVCRLNFVCEDDGAGISEEFQAHIFEPFAQESGGRTSDAGGVGLGLAVVKKILDERGGTIRVQSAKGKGSRFEVNLPLKPTDMAIPEAADRELPSLAGRQILVVEDNDLNREIAVYLLKEAGAQVLEATDGTEAVEQFNAHKPGEIDAIVMDVMMQGMNGLDATRAIRAMERSDADVPILAMTANLFDEDVAACREAGMNAHIAKPLDARRMLQTIADCIDHKNTGFEGRKP